MIASAASQRFVDRSFNLPCISEALPVARIGILIAQNKVYMTQGSAKNPIAIAVSAIIRSINEVAAASWIALIEDSSKGVATL